MQSANILSNFDEQSDSNCVQILAPTNAVPQLPASFNPGERIGNISRDAAQIMSEYMDEGKELFDKNDIYGKTFLFVCRLREDTNHTKGGYAIDIVVLSINGEAWTDLFIEVLEQKNVNCIKLN